MVKPHIYREGVGGFGVKKCKGSMNTYEESQKDMPSEGFMANTTCGFQVLRVAFTLRE